MAIIIRDLAEVLAVFEESGFISLREEWISYDAFNDQVVNISSGDGSTIKGRSQGVNDAGSLEVLTEDGVKIFASGEITVRSTT